MDARAATGFAGAARAYDRGRPSWPPEAVARIARELALPAGATALDLAAGTGKLTALLPAIAGTVLAVEPAEPMLEILREQLPGVDARLGRAEDIPFADEVADVVLVAEAFHWFDVPAATREIARVLRPGGGLAVLWHRGAWEERDATLFDRYQAIVGPLRDAAGAFPSGADVWTDGLADSGLFGPLQRFEVVHDQELDPDGFVALAASMSWIVNLPDGHREAVLAEVRGLVDGREELVLRHRAEVHLTRKRLR
jgi:SAM-dependent methyltransferase